MIRLEHNPTNGHWTARRVVGNQTTDVAGQEDPAAALYELAKRLDDRIDNLENPEVDG